MIRKFTMILASGIAISALAQDLPVPDDAVVINSADNVATLNSNVWDQLYGPSDWHYEVRQAPKFLLVGDGGNIAFGIGMLIKGTMQYDFDGAILTNGYLMSVDVPVPRSAADRSALLGNAAGSKIYARLAGNSPLGGYGAYVETDFTEGLYLRQAWVNLGYLRVGKATSIFNDHDATPSTINEQAPCGATCSENVGIQWTPRFGKDQEWTAGIGIEVPEPTFAATRVEDPHSRSYADDDAYIPQRMPDVPVYLQYSWDDRDSRVRLSGIARSLTYLDAATQTTHHQSGWGLQLSSVVASVSNTTFFAEATYGKGIGSYIYDLCGYGYDLIPSGVAGGMIAPASLSGFAAVQYDFTDRFAVTAFYSQARLYDSSLAGDDAFRLGQTASVNGIYEVADGLEVGIEYEWARRTNANLESNHANRLTFMCSYTF